MTASRDLRVTLRAHLQDRASSWSIGADGAIAEFHWLPGDDPGNAYEDLRVVTDAGGLLLELRDDVVAHAYQGLSRHPDRWLQGIALCLPWRRARRRGRQLLTELGRDRSAMRAADRQAVLFDLGLGLPYVDACVRSASPELLKALRSYCGRSLLEAGNRIMPAIIEASPQRVFVSRLGRLEVYQRIGSAQHHPPTPQGPHTHVLPQLLGARRTHAGHNEAPAYYRACATLYPKHPLVDNLGNPTAYDHEAHGHFTALLERWGDPAFLAEKRRARRTMRAGLDPRRYRPPADARARLALRIAIRELAHQMDDPDIIEPWRSRFDRD